MSSVGGRLNPPCTGKDRNQPLAPILPSIADQIIAATSVPSNFSMATMPVGEVTLISVSH